MSKQPKWTFVENLGNKSPLDHGGLFLYRDETGVYPEEIERLKPLGWDTVGDESFEVRSFLVERLLEAKNMLVPLMAPKWAEDHGVPVETWVEWFSEPKKMFDVELSSGYTAYEIREAFVSTDASTRARAYIAVADYYGWEYFDAAPQVLTREQVLARYVGQYSERNVRGILLPGR